MTWLTEDPLWIILAGLATATIFLVMLQFGSRKILFKKITTVALIITVTVFVFEKIYLTDREQLTNAVLSMASGARANNTKKVVRHISQSRPDVIQRISDEMSHLKFDECKIVKVNNIQINQGTERRASIDFTLFVNIDAREKYMCRAKGTREVRFQFAKEQNWRWRLVGGKNLPLQGISPAVTRLRPATRPGSTEDQPHGFQANPPAFSLDINF